MEESHSLLARSSICISLKLANGWLIYLFINLKWLEYLNIMHLKYISNYVLFSGT